MYVFLIVLITLLALVMTIAILLQSGKGGGLAGIAAGGQATQILGARQAPDFLEKATWTMGTAFIVLCIVANFFAGPSQGPGVIQDDSVNIPGETAPALPQGPGTINDEFVPPAQPAPAPQEAPAE